jgi:hypothetical protein
MSNLGPERGEIARLVDRRAADVTVEIALGALREADWPVHVDPKAGIG